MPNKALFRPAITLCMLLFVSALMSGCTDADLVAPERESEAEIDDAVTNNGGVQKETANVFGQGPDGDVVAADGATLRRTPNGISVKVQMPTPLPETYDYPDPYTVENGFPTVAPPGHPEVFTLWVFADGVPFHGGGHAVGGETLTLSGHISKNTEPFAPEGEEPPEPPEDVSDAEVHIAIAPHGALDDKIMPEQIETPGGAPAHWWFAEFEAE